MELLDDLAINLMASFGLWYAVCCVIVITNIAIIKTVPARF